MPMVRGGPSDPEARPTPAHEPRIPTAELATHAPACRRPRVAVVDDMPIGGGVLGAMLTRLGCEIVASDIVDDGADTVSRSRPDVIFASVGYGVGWPGEAPVSASHRIPLVSYGPADRPPSLARPPMSSDVHLQEPLRLADVSRALDDCLMIERRSPAWTMQRAGIDVERSFMARASDGLAIEIAAFRRQDCVNDPAECARLAHRIVSSVSILDLRHLTSACLGLGSCWAQGLHLGPAHARVLDAMADAERAAAGATGSGGTGRRDAVPAAIAGHRSPLSW